MRIAGSNSAVRNQVEGMGGRMLTNKYDDLHSPWVSHSKTAITAPHNGRATDPFDHAALTGPILLEPFKFRVSLNGAHYREYMLGLLWRKGRILSAERVEAHLSV